MSTQDFPNIKKLSRQMNDAGEILRDVISRLAKLEKYERREPKEYPEFIETDDLPKMGWVRINHIGEENIYFTKDDGSKWFIKSD